MEGQLDEMVNALQASDMEQRLKEAGLGAVTSVSANGSGHAA